MSDTTPGADDTIRTLQEVSTTLAAALETSTRTDDDWRTTTARITQLLLQLHTEVRELIAETRDLRVRLNGQS